MTTPYNPLRNPRDNFQRHAGAVSRLVLGEPPAAAPRVSILIPTFRRPQLLEEAVASALQQAGFDDYEVIVLDNDPAGDAATEAVIRRHLRPGLMYYRNDVNLGMTGNWNRIIELARGEWITLLHDDDWLAPGFLRLMVAGLPADADLMVAQAMIGSASYDPSLLPPPEGSPTPTRVSPELMVLGNLSPAPGILVRRRVVLAAGGYDDDYYPCADYDLGIRIALTGRAYHFPAVLSYYRNSDSETFKGDTFSRIVEKSIWMKQGLLGHCGALLGPLFYVESMRRWSVVGMAHDKPVASHSRLDRLAASIARRPLLSRCFRLAFSLVNWGVRGLVRRAARGAQPGL